MNKTEKALRILIDEIEKGLDIDLATVNINTVDWPKFMKYHAYGLQKLKQELDK